MNTLPTTSVFIPSFRRPHLLAKCLRALMTQTTPPDEVLVVWQADDVPTREMADSLKGELPSLRVLHSPEAGVVPAENTALDAANGEIVLLIDDDAIAGPEWVARHLAHYADPTVGAVGGPADNFHPDGSPFPRRDVEPVGRLSWYGRLVGNAHDQPESWRSRPPREVDHLVGYNFSLRRSAFGRFALGLRRYWQLFELEACLQVRASGHRIVFDFGNVVEHHPSNTAYVDGREGDLEVKVFNAAFNQAFVLARHSPLWVRPARLAYLLLVGSVNVPGVLGSLVAMKRFGKPRRELSILGRTWRAVWQGWRAGRVDASTSPRPGASPRRSPGALEQPCTVPVES